ncbi:hypothetical protein E0H26_28460 [Micromonospora zingiberis]|uniref:Uncharacterized protein n=1 Tax=Micromonospora zingiberis TaxID=2053011 RepID=A0A4R0FX49_9ACTN|nr:hypothetical protein [Micromonospora zingiberis]TCB88654.1 hypothetical protein E0H26_28460 [Micromonospora zingiberis]
MSILGVELRRSAAVGAALITVLVGVGALYGAPARWSGGWMSLAMVLREYLILMWPLALAAGAWQGRREHRAKVGELFATTARPRAQRMLPVLGALAITFAVAYLLVTVVGLAWIVSVRYVPLLNFAVVTGVGVLALIGAAWLGLGIGRLLPALATAPALGVAGVLLVSFSLFISPDWLAAAMSPIYGTSQFHSYPTIDNRVSGAIAIWMVALAVTGLLLFVAGSWRARTAALVPVLLGLTVAVAVVPRDPAVLDAPVDPIAQVLVCTDDAPTVCVSRVNTHVLDALTPLAREGLAALAKLPGAPTAVHEDTSTFGRGAEIPPRDDVVRIPVRIDKRGGLAHPAVVAPEIVRGLGVAYDGSCRLRSEAVERAAAYWLLGREPRSDVGLIPGLIQEEPEINAEALILWQGLRELSDDEALARVAAVRDAALACEDPSELLSRSAG